MTTHDQLFLLTPNFADGRVGTGIFHCPECAQVEGLLSYYPYLRGRVDVHYVDFARPRAEIVPLVGAENQSCPLLVLAGRPPEGMAVRQHDASGRWFVAGAPAIAAYLAAVHGIPAAHP
ncbi:MAG: DUF3088 family protein [Verrucomicrobia bacterium]|nr:DUF3088 family protein [Verrucomicrobiota bacterium]